MVRLRPGVFCFRENILLIFKIPDSAKREIIFLIKCGIKVLKFSICQKKSLYNLGYISKRVLFITLYVKNKTL